MNKRAERRAHIERIKAKRRNYWGQRLVGKQLCLAVSTAAICSCWMCGNPRKYVGERTVQERRAMQEID